MCKKIGRIVKRMDLFAEPVKLLINQDDSHKTWIGAFFSFGLIIIMILLITPQLESFLTFQNPTIVQNEGFNEQPDLFYLTKNNFTLMIAITHPDTHISFLDESILSLSLRNTYAHSEINSEGKYTTINSETFVPLIKCSVEALKQDEFDDFLQNHFDLQSNFCIDYDKIDKIQIQGISTAKQYRALTLDVNSCVNSTTNSNYLIIHYIRVFQKKCAPKEVIDSFLKRGLISFQVSDTLLDLNNPTNPQIFQIKDMFTTISNTMIKEIDYLMKFTYLNVDQAFITSESKQQSFISYSKLVERIDIGKSTRFCQINFKLENKFKTISINYKKLQDIFGNIGGIWSVLYTIISFLLRPIQSFSTKILLVNQFFNFEVLQPKDVVSIPIRRSYNIQKSNQDFNKKKKYYLILQKDLSCQNVFEAYTDLQEIDEQIKKTPLQIKEIRKIQILIKNYFQETTQKLNLKLIDYLSLIIPFFKWKSDIVQNQINYSFEKLKNSIDIVYIAKKLNEIDKLKMLLLDENQINLFDYIVEPKILQKPEKSMENKKVQWTILKKNKNSVERACDAFIAYKKIINQKDEQINQKLVDMLDENIVELFQVEDGKNNEKNNEINIAKYLFIQNSKQQNLY